MSHIVNIRRGRILGKRAGYAAIAVAVAGALLASPLPTWLDGSGSAGRVARAEVAGEAGTMSAQPFSFADVVERVRPAVVSIQISGTTRTSGRRGGSEEFGGLPEDHPFNEFFKRFFNEPGVNPFGNNNERRRPNTRPRSQAQGSGFFISSDGYLVTNNHVVSGGKEINVVLENGKSYPARLVGSDERTDLALLKVDDGPEFPAVEFAEGTTRIGDWVVAVGNPFGLGGTVTAGIISARGRDIGSGPYDDFIQIDAPINRGNSGGPAFNLNGEVIGVNTAIFSPSGGSVGIGFAIPADVARSVIADLKDDGNVTRGWLGVTIQSVNDDIAESLGLDKAKGALITELASDGPADKAGLEDGDLILQVNGEQIDDSKDLARTVAALVPNSTAKIRLMRDGKDMDIDVRLGTLPKDLASIELKPRTEREKAAAGDEIEALGLTLVAASSVDGANGAGVIIVDIVEEAPAYTRGLRVGDHIIEVAGQPVHSAQDVRDQMKRVEQQGRNSVLMQVRSGNRQRFVALPLVLS